MKKILVLTSGGLDSTVLLYKAISLVDKENVVMLNMYYGQKHDIEIKMARWQAENTGCEYHELDISKTMQFNVNSSALLKGSTKEIAHESYAEQLKNTDVVSAYVPYRNGLFLSIAASIAYQLGCDTVAYGAHADDAVRRVNGGAAYPDCTPEFVESQRAAIREGTAGKVGLWAPLWDKSKSEVVLDGIEAGMTRDEFEHTHSCYEGVEGGCGTCGTCVREDQRVLMSDWSYRAIKDVKVGEQVWSFNDETGQLELATVTEVLDRGIKPVYELQHEGGSLFLTKDHRIWIETPYHKFNSWKEYQSLYKHSRATYILRYWNGLTVNDDKAYALGYLRGFCDGDGCYHDRGIFTCQKERTVLEEFWALYNQYIKPTDAQVHWDESRQIFIGSGGYRPAFDEATDWEIWKHSDDYLLGYLNGIIISDGCIAHNSSNGSRHWTISQSLDVNSDIVEQIDYALNRIAIKYNTWVSTSKPREDSYCPEGGRHQKGWLGHDVWKLPFRYGTKKKEAILQKEQEWYRVRNLQKVQLLEYFTDTPVEESHVYDINTTSHTFICEGVLVHNCRDRTAALDTWVHTRNVGQSGVKRIITNK